jgi:hypothetical protein
MTLAAASEGPLPRRRPRDRLLLWPGLVATAAVLCLTFLCGLPGLVSFVLIPTSVLGYLAAVVALCVFALVLLIRRRPRQAASVVIAILMPALLWAPITWAADCLHLALTAGFGAGQLKSRSKPDGEQFGVYDWSIGLAGGPNTFLIHDVTDDIALPIARHIHPLSSENGFGEECSGKVKHLIGHYYVCTF